ncbi:MAG TPA: hypothetical protein VK718_03575 [Ferruginibacter sp.]|jgi:hypothetical protein|nr:hypothetical protein [Ferruginibacter sp.]
MKKAIGFIIFFLVIRFVSVSQQVDPINIPHLGFTAKIESIKSMDQGVYISISTTVINNFPDTLQYLTMSCSWGKYYVLDTRAIFLPVPQCNNDSALLVKIAPRKQEVRVIRLISLETARQLHNVKFRIGFKFVQADVTNKASKQLKRSKNIVWSNTICIK